jgi:hypothetical protein
VYIWLKWRQSQVPPPVREVPLQRTPPPRERLVERVRVGTL